MENLDELLSKLDGLRAAAKRHNENPEYAAAGYPAIAPFCATIRYPDKPPYVALFNASLAEGAAYRRFQEIDFYARFAATHELTIELASLR